MSTENKMTYIDDETEEMLDDLIDQVEENAMEEAEEAEENSFKIEDFNNLIDYEISRQEPDKKIIEFTIKDDLTTYKGKAMKKSSDDAVIFLLMNPESKLKKIKISQVDTFN